MEIKLTTTFSVRACVIVLGLVLLMNGCANAGMVKYESHTSLGMISKETETSYLEHWNKLSQVFKEEDKEKEKKIASECGIILLEVEEDGEKKQGEKSMPLTSFIIAEVISLVLDEINKELQEHLKRYSAVYKANVTPPNFYKKTGSPELQSNCFHFSRFLENESNESRESPVVDLIGQMRITEDGDALQIRPLRLYQSEAMAESDDKSYGIAASIRMKAVWLQENRGMREEVFNHTFLKKKITLSKPALEYFLDKGWENYPVLPLPPWSTNVGSSSPAGNVEIIISMAESGKPNELLKFFAESFKSEREDIAELLNDAAEAHILP